MTEAQELLGFFRGYEPLISLAFAGVVAVCTIVYVLLTLRLLSETARMRKVHTDPCVDFTIRSSTRGFFDACVKNIGNGPAYNVRFDVVAKNDTPATVTAMDRLGKFNFIRNGIAYLSPDQQMDAYFTNAYDDKAKAWDVCFDVLVEYQGRNRQKHKECFTVDLSEQFGGSCLVEDDYLKEMSKELKKVASQLAGLTTGRSTIKVQLIKPVDDPPKLGGAANGSED